MLDQVVQQYTAGTLTDPVVEWEKTSHVFWRVVCRKPVTVIFGLFTGLCAWSLLSLLFYHLRTISIAQTTNERVRGVFRGDASGNPVDEGCRRNWLNCMHILCHPPVSLLPQDFSEEVFESREVQEYEWKGEHREGTTTRNGSVASFQSSV